MCLFKIRKEEDYPAVRVYERKRVHRAHPQDEIVRYSRTSVNRSSYPTIPSPRFAQIPAPQPVPVFVRPPSPPPATTSAPQYVTVSPRSSVDDGYYRREVRVEREHSRSRSRDARRSRSGRSRSRARYYDDSDDEDDYEYAYRRRRERY